MTIGHKIMKKEDRKFGALIREKRKKLGLSQRKLAEKMGCDSSLVSKWEKDQRVPEGRNFVNLIVFLEMVPELFPGYVKQELQYTCEEIEELRAEVSAVKDDTKHLKKVVNLLIDRELGKKADELIAKLAGA